METSPTLAVRSVLVHCIGEYQNVTVTRTVTVLVPDDLVVDLQDPEEIDDWIHDWLYDEAGNLGLTLSTPTLTSSEAWEADRAYDEDREPADWTFTVIRRAF